ncbi:hypothetical protein [Caldithrix abyssi]|uniref:hypothetical protein n=1 Tax=Caldithrix abyssi TaxID=187145 RepID=UPI0005C6EF33|nr:hypothetical protein [Caldithrix abyssi]
MKRSILQVQDEVKANTVNPCQVGWLNGNGWPKTHLPFLWWKNLFLANRADFFYFSESICVKKNCDLKISLRLIILKILAAGVLPWIVIKP